MKNDAVMVGGCSQLRLCARSGSLNQAVAFSLHTIPVAML